MLSIRQLEKPVFTFWWRKLHILAISELESNLVCNTTSHSYHSTPKLRKPPLLLSSVDAALDRAYGNKPLSEIESLFTAKASVEIDTSIKDVIKLIYHAVQNNLVTDLDQIVEKIVHLTQVPNPIVNALIEGYMKMSQVHKAGSLYQRLIHQGFKPDSHTIILLIQGFLHHSDIVKAEAITNSLPILQIPKSAAVYNLWIGFWLKEQQLEKARSIFRTMEEMGISPTELTFRIFIKYFLLRGDFKAADRVKKQMTAANILPTIEFYETLLRVLFKRGARVEIENILEEIKQVGMQPTRGLWNTLVAGWMQLGEMEIARNCLDDMIKCGYCPSVVTFNRLLNNAVDALDMEQTQALLIKMDSLGIGFNAFTYASIFRGLVGQKRYPEAVGILFKMDEQSASVPIEIYSNLIKLCCERNFDPGVTVLLQQMKSRQVTPNLYLYTSLLKYNLRKRNYTRVDAILVEMQRKHYLRPNLFILATLLDHFVENLDFGRIKLILQQIHSLGLEMTQPIYNIVMKAFYVHVKFMEGGKVQLATNRTDLFSALNSTLSNTTTNQPLEAGNINTLTTNSSNGESTALLDQKSNADAYKIADVLQKLEGLEHKSLERMKILFAYLFPELKFRPCIHMFNEVMNKLFFHLHFDKMFECYQEIKALGLKPNLITFTLLIKAHLYTGDPLSAKKRLYELLRLGLKPTIFQAALIFHFHCRRLDTEEAEILLDEFPRTFGVCPLNYVFYASLIYAYARKHEYDAVFRTFDRLERNGLIPDTETCNYVLISLFELGEYAQALRFLEQMKQQSIQRNTYTYSIIAGKLLQRGDVAKCLEILADSRLSGNSINATPYNRLLQYLYLNGKMDMIVNVMDHMIEGCVRFDADTLQFVSFCYLRTISSGGIEGRSRARKILEKALIDYEETTEPLGILLSRFREECTIAEDWHNGDTIEKFMAKLPELRIKMTQISPDLMDTIKSNEAFKMIMVGNQEQRLNKGDDGSNLGNFHDHPTKPADLNVELNRLNAIFMDECKENGEDIQKYCDQIEINLVNPPVVPTTQTDSNINGDLSTGKVPEINTIHSPTTASVKPALLDLSEFSNFGELLAQRRPSKLN